VPATRLRRKLDRVAPAKVELRNSFRFRTGLWRLVSIPKSRDSNQRFHLAAVDFSRALTGGVRPRSGGFLRVLSAPHVRGQLAAAVGPFIVGHMIGDPAAFVAEARVLFCLHSEMLRRSMDIRRNSG